jgi:hypothetical protein
MHKTVSPPAIAAENQKNQELIFIYMILLCFFDCCFLRQGVTNP